MPYISPRVTRVIESHITADTCRSPGPMMLALPALNTRGACVETSETTVLQLLFFLMDRFLNISHHFLSFPVSHFVQQPKNILDTEKEKTQL